jgi:hypothetical protein
VDAIMIMDDRGTQRGMMVSPRVFRRHFRPMYEDYVAIARRYGKFVFMHSDGNILDIMEDLIAVGIDALNSQVACMGIAELGRRFAGRITVWGEIDRQVLLAHGTPAEVEEATRRAGAPVCQRRRDCPASSAWSDSENVLHVRDVSAPIPAPT